MKTERSTPTLNRTGSWFKSNDSGRKITSEQTQTTEKVTRASQSLQEPPDSPTFSRNRRSQSFTTGQSNPLLVPDTSRRSKEEGSTPEGAELLRLKRKNLAQSLSEKVGSRSPSQSPESDPKSSKSFFIENKGGKNPSTFNQKVPVHQLKILDSKNEEAKFENHLNSHLKQWLKDFSIPSLWKEKVSQHADCVCWRNAGCKLAESDFSLDTSIRGRRKYEDEVLQDIVCSLTQGFVLFRPLIRVLRPLSFVFTNFLQKQNNCTQQSLHLCLALKALLQMVEQEGNVGEKLEGGVEAFRQRLNEVLSAKTFSKVICGSFGGEKGIQEYQNAVDYWVGEGPRPLLEKKVHAMLDSYIDLMEALEEPFSWKESLDEPPLAKLGIHHIIRSVSPDPDSALLFRAVQVNGSPVNLEVNPSDKLDSQNIIFTQLITAINEAAFGRKEIEEEVKQQVEKLLNEEEIPSAMLLRLGTINSRMLAHKYIRTLMSQVLDLSDIKIHPLTPTLDINVESYTRGTVTQAIKYQFQKTEILRDGKGWIDRTLFHMTFTWKLFLEEAGSMPLPISGKLFISIPEYYEATDEEREAITQNLLILREKVLRGELAYKKV